MGLGQIAQLPVLTMTLGYSRLLEALMIPSRHVQDLISGHSASFTSWGVVSTALVSNGEAALSSRRSWE